MSTRIKIPASWINNRDDFDINDFIAGQGLTVVSRTRSQELWIILVSENLNAGEQTALSVQLENNLNIVTYEIIP